MFDTLDEVREQLLAGEDSFAEFKEVRVGDRTVISPNTENFAEELAAFANTEGGAIFLGVGNDGVVRGIPRAELGTVEGWVLNVAADRCQPPIRPLIRKLVLPSESSDEVPVMLVEVRKSVFVHRTLAGRYMTRVGSQKRDLTPAELARLLQQRTRQFAFDESLVTTATREDLDDERILEAIGAPGVITFDRLLRNTRIIGSDDAGVARPTVAGLLAFGREPAHELPNAVIDAAVYRGILRESGHLTHSERITGPVDVQIERAVAFVDRLMLRPARRQVGREEFPQYPIGAVFEAVVNSVAHRDYSIGGSNIRLFLYADRLELISPGGLPNTLTLETLPYRQFTRNQLLVSFLGRMRSRSTGRAFIEARGEGVQRILREGAEHAGRAPEYSLAGEQLTLTIWAKEPPNAEI